MQKKDLKLWLIFLYFFSKALYATTNIDELNKETQNPIADLISVPFQNNWGFKVGPHRQTQFTLNIQPVIPYHINPKLNLITRIVLPIMSQPYLGPGLNNTQGLGNTTITGFISLNISKKFIWGAGPAILLPTSTNTVLGEKEYGLGPSFIALVQEGPWTAGILTNQIWSVAGKNTYPISQLLFQPFAAYAFDHGWSTSFASESTCNWKRNAKNQWTVPLDLVVSKIQVISKLPISIGGGLRYFPVKPELQATWGLRLNISLLFPT